MTERKPAGVSWGSWIDRQIEKARQRGDFDDLPGSGRPIADLDQPHDEMWWVKRKLRDEGVSFLPPTLAIRKDLQDTLARLGSIATEAEARRALEELNTRIRKVNRTATDGPPSSTMPVDVEAVLADWRAGPDR
ncbi:MAG TPA: DUF1992 domain-containing protein [Acidimicrobiales bacterium]|nr:DUF1992 domain-containing protein [Acidimicrobiales bacterium]